MYQKTSLGFISEFELQIILPPSSSSSLSICCPGPQRIIYLATWPPSRVDESPLTPVSWRSPISAVVTFSKIKIIMASHCHGDCLHRRDGIII